MKETIILFLERGSVWLFASIIYCVVTMCVGWFTEEVEHEQLEVAHFIGCLMFGAVFCLWLYG